MDGSFVSIRIIVRSTGTGVQVEFVGAAKMSLPCVLPTDLAGVEQWYKSYGGHLGDWFHGITEF